MTSGIYTKFTEAIEIRFVISGARREMDSSSIDRLWSLCLCGSIRFADICQINKFAQNVVKIRELRNHFGRHFVIPFKVRHDPAPVGLRADAATSFLPGNPAGAATGAARWG